VAILSAGRGVYLVAVAHADRRFVEVGLADTPWHDALRWIGRQPADWHVLAEPEHALRYGASVRAGAGRDTVLEIAKDSAMAMYDRTVAMRVADRAAALAGFANRSTDDVRALDARYGLDVVIVERGHRLDLPELYRNARFVIYDLR
jgi:hypothetical protein